MDELERTGENLALPTQSATTRLEMLDAAAAIRLAESFAGAHVHGDALHAGGAAELLDAVRDAADKAERASAVVRVEALAASRDTLRRIARARLGVVVHAIADHGDEELAALSDVGWGVLCAAGPEDSFDLTLVARRAAEDSGVPFVVVHALGNASAGAGRAIAMVAVPPEKACQAFVGTKSRLKPRHDPAHPSLAPATDRVFAQRAPFALGSALREYGNVSGRRHDAFDKVPLGEPTLVLVGMGPVGDALLCSVSELRVRGYDVGAIHVTALRPFPGARLVKALSRALAVTVLEASDEPLTAHGGLLARDLKSAFTDALTWVPGFPGIGRIPKVSVGVTGPSFDLEDLAAVCENMLIGEQGKRSFSLPDAEHALPRAARVDHVPTTSVSVRWVLDDLHVGETAMRAASAALAELLGLRVNGVVTPHGGGATVDVFASRDHARGIMARRGPRLVLASLRGALTGEATRPLASGAVLGVLGAGDGDATIPDSVRAAARDRRARILPLAIGAGLDASLSVAALSAGATVAAAVRGQRSHVDPSAVARVVGKQLGSDEAGERARSAFEVTLEAGRAADAGARNGTVPAR
jgi:pyruvate ferredoxin oxidoreductase alpha subunit